MLRNRHLFLGFGFVTLFQPVHMMKHGLAFTHKRLPPLEETIAKQRWGKEKIMSIKSTHAETAMVVRYQTGLNAEGQPLIRQKSLAKVKESAALEEVYAVATALFSLLEYPIVEIRRNSSHILTEE
ncbi:DUF1659 domain-containing protein [Desulfosporosinus shakirovi]|uniref:DUF1659 domain-containing protein n=1 Tax=Desulfosporosinus shakirovi TaxID=2885154 RepID=UPI001E4E8E1F|nr:DUF1659 domain-containing protein [Desulfosporosinus sp. SRJS8]MCB8818067.1 DUF1659 domain-containing protein [Desulfosporosinus sp. SRJS8]